MIHLTNEEYDNLLRQIEKGTEFSIEYLKERNEQKQRADECCKVIDNLGRCAKLQEEKIDRLENRWSELKEKLFRYENIPQRIQSFETVLALMNEMERIEMEDNNDI
ncbi:hypothetical protein ETI09_03565 [Macrococcoides canis]|uniref:hypothetical protein n=1 Tax=Macrococcoides canis TaxID=1855823 RepID=UPI00105C0B90|nr:hypothetical protein [Macrococcus canis]TDM43463.1 hypothetical protein ETI09_03565 [Macrococcus canis]